MTHTISKALFDWFLACPLLSKDRKINVDYLPDEMEEYSINTVPTEPVVKRYADGSTVRQYLFILASSEILSKEPEKHLDNLRFYEKLAEWIEKQSQIKNLPELGNKSESISIEVLSSGYLFDEDVGFGRYQMQLNFKYFMEANNV